MHDESITLRQCTHRAQQLVSTLKARHPILGGKRLEWPLACGTSDRSQVPGSRATPGPCLVGDNCQQPWAKRGSGVKLSQMVEHLDEGLLDRVLRVAGARDHGRGAVGQ